MYRPVASPLCFRELGTPGQVKGFWCYWALSGKEWSKNQKGKSREKKRKTKERSDQIVRPLVSGCSPKHQEVVQRPCSAFRLETNLILSGTALQLVLSRKNTRGLTLPSMLLVTLVFWYVFTADSINCAKGRKCRGSANCYYLAAIMVIKQRYYQMTSQVLYL